MNTGAVRILKNVETSPKCSSALLLPHSTRRNVDFLIHNSQYWLKKVANNPLKITTISIVTNFNDTVLIR